MLVCEHFNPNPGHKPQVDHKDEDKSNNRADNLRWCTDQENKDFYYEKDPSRRRADVSSGYKISDIMKAVCVNGVEYPSAGMAAKHICSIVKSNKDTVSKELRKMISGKRSFGTMYNQFTIRPVS